MNESLIKNWNSRVKTEDTVFHLGDFCFKETKHTANYFTSRLNGKIIFIRGNHDSNNGIRTCIEDIRIHLAGKDFLLTHRPEDFYPGVQVLLLCGHVHGAWKFKNINWFEDSYEACNVGIDVWKYYPIDIQEIMKEYHKWKRGITT